MTRENRKKSSASIDRNHQVRETILAAALKVFARDGFAGASLPRIAAMAQVTPPLVYYYFQSKDNLWRETVDYSMRGILSQATAIRNATRALDPRERLRALIHAFVEFAAHSPEHVVMIMSEAGARSERFHWAQDNYSNVLLTDNLAILDQLKRDGIIRDAPIDQIAFSLFGGILMFFTISQNLPTGKDLDKLSQDYAELVFTMFMDGLAIDKGEGVGAA